MKKYLMTGAAALALCAGFVSCSHDEDLYDSTIAAKANPVVEKYNTAFVNVFGQPAENQEWGFGKNVAASRVTRAASTNENQWEDQGWILPDDVTDQEIADVLAVFNQKGKASYESLVDWSDFFVVQIYKGVAEYTNHAGGNVVGSQHMDWLCTVTNKHVNVISWWPYEEEVVIGDEYDDHINNFNNGNCGTDAVSEKTGKEIKGMMLMVNSNTNKFGFKSSEDNGHVFYNFRMEKIGKYYYVGFDFEAAGQNPNEQVDRDYIYNDWIVRIVPGKGVTPEIPDQAIRVFAEDLSATEATDFDFNDIVFDAEYISDTQAKIKVWAAGGTLPLNVCSKDGVFYGGGFEVHDGFGVPVTCMVNTHAKPIIKDKKYSAKDNMPAYTKIITLPENIGEILGLSADEPTKFDKNNFAYSVRNLIRLEVKKDKWYELTAAKGEPACKIAGPVGKNATSTELGIRWLLERKSIEAGYPNFKNYVGTGYPTNWWSNEVNELMYSKNSTPKGFTVTCDENAPHE